MTMRITEWWTTRPNAGELKAELTYPRYGGHKSAEEGARELARRFDHRLLYKGKREVFFAESLYVQRIRFEG